MSDQKTPPRPAIEFHNRTRNIVPIQLNDGTSASVGGKGRIIIPLELAGHASIAQALRIRDLVRGRTLMVDAQGLEVDPLSQEAPAGEVLEDEPA